METHSRSLWTALLVSHPRDEYGNRLNVAKRWDESNIVFQYLSPFFVLWEWRNTVSKCFPLVIYFLAQLGPFVGKQTTGDICILCVVFFWCIIVKCPILFFFMLLLLLLPFQLDFSRLCGGENGQSSWTITPGSLVVFLSSWPTFFGVWCPWNEKTFFSSFFFQLSSFSLQSSPHMQASTTGPLRLFSFSLWVTLQWPSGNPPSRRRIRAGQTCISFLEELFFKKKITSSFVFQDDNLTWEVLHW